MNVYFQGSCAGFREVLKVYNEVTPHIKLNRPTNFAPLIRKSIEIVKATEKVSQTLKELSTFYDI